MTDHSIAYFSMEIALEPSIPTYSGGLGALAGDTIRSAADLKVPMVAVSLLYRKGYFYQRLDDRGNQAEEPVDWAVDDYMKEMKPRASVTIEGRTVHLRAWKYEVTGLGGHTVPVYLLDSDLPDNAEWDRTITHNLYGGDVYYRLCQEVVLGIGGIRMLRALGYNDLARYHMNEGHAGLLTLELLDEERAGGESITGEDIEAVRKKCIFTTHTPVPAGHDQFPMDLVKKVVGGGRYPIDREDVFALDVANRIFQQRGDFTGIDELIQKGTHLNMTYLALNLSGYINGVAKKHGEVSRLMFADYEIDAITNGVHAASWTSDPFQKLFDARIPGWKLDNFSLRYALSIPRADIWQAHIEAKKKLFQEVNRLSNIGLDKDYFTLGFARRAATYKRADMLFRDPERLKHMASKIGPLQVVYAGKAHPRDEKGKEIIRRIFEAKAALKKDVKVVYLPNYDTRLAALMTAGVDCWLNTPKPPNEASGTSGMKAALNGVPSLSILDGWWIEGCIEGITGWSIGDGGDHPDRTIDDVLSLYDKLEKVVLPLYYKNKNRFIDIMRHCIALNGSFFNTHRMVRAYVLKAYFH